MHEYGLKENLCPYFAQIRRIKIADIIFMPYNYIVNRSLRRNLDINLENSIVIFDEAHNIVSTAEDTESYSITAKLLSQCIDQLNVSIQ